MQSCKEGLKNDDNVVPNSQLSTNSSSFVETETKRVTKDQKSKKDYHDSTDSEAEETLSVDKIAKASGYAMISTSKSKKKRVATCTDQEKRDNSEAEVSEAESEHKPGPSTSSTIKDDEETIANSQLSTNSSVETKVVKAKRGKGLIWVKDQEYGSQKAYCKSQTVEDLKTMQTARR